MLYPLSYEGEGRGRGWCSCRSEGSCRHDQDRALDLRALGVPVERATCGFLNCAWAGETGDKYVRNTVLFASVLFLVAMAQRISGRGPRFAANGIAVALLIFVTSSMVRLPRL